MAPMTAPQCMQLQHPKIQAKFWPRFIAAGRQIHHMRKSEARHSSITVLFLLSAIHIQISHPSPNDLQSTIFLQAKGYRITDNASSYFIAPIHQLKHCVQACNGVYKINVCRCQGLLGSKRLATFVHCVLRGDLQRGCGEKQLCEIWYVLRVSIIVVDASRSGPGLMIGAQYCEVISSVLQARKLICLLDKTWPCVMLSSQAACNVVPSTKSSKTL